MLPVSVRFHLAQTRAFYLHKLMAHAGTFTQALGDEVLRMMLKSGGGTAARVWPLRIRALREISIHFIAFQVHSRYLQDVGCFL